jgi:F-type H+-transporting ATPase subunit a
MRFLKSTTGKTTRAGLSAAFLALAAACWLLPARAQDDPLPPPPPPAAPHTPPAPHGDDLPPPPPDTPVHAPAEHGEPHQPPAADPHTTPGAHPSVPLPSPSDLHESRPGPGGTHGPVTGGTHPVGEHADPHADPHHDTAHDGEHGAAHAEPEFDIHLKTWLYGPLQRLWFSGPATLTADGAVGPDGRPVDAAMLRGRQVEYVHEYHHKEYHTRPTLGEIGDQLPQRGDRTHTLTVEGQQVTLVNPRAHFFLEGAIPEGLVLSLVTALLVGGALFMLTRNLQRVPSRPQILLEMGYQMADGFVAGLIGPGYKKYVPLIGTAFIYIFFMNIGILFPGWGAATANINVTAGMAAVIIVYVQIEGLRANGLKGYLLHFVGDPWWLAPLNFPLHVIGEVARVLSLTIRLFGNIFGEDTVIVILILLSIKFFLGGLIPGQFPMYPLALFTGAVQAMVFCILSCVYIALMTTHDHGEEHGAHEHGHDGHGHGHDAHAPAPAV